MLFNSLSFGIFLTITYVLYWSFFRKNVGYRNIFLLFISYFFYGWWNWKLLPLIAGISAIDYFSGSLIAKRQEKSGNGKGVLILSLILNLGVLCFFKYFNFFAESLSAAFGFLSGNGSSFNPLDIVLPVGISFYTFQGLSYVLDIYYKKTSPTKDAVAFFAFISFFPQLIAGPIERSKDLLPQFSEKKIFDYDEARIGLLMIALGLFKKMVIADRLAIFVDSVYSNPSTHQGLPALVAVLFFAFQLYLDFSAYSQIAVGTARLFGFRLHDNFKRPYLSISFKDFWKRWHITLTSWFMDYLYIPLGGNRKGKARTILNVMIVFAISGLWHGASWNFVIWGCINGLFLVLSSKVFNMRPETKPAKVLSCLFVFCVWAFSLVFFRADSFPKAIEMFSSVGFSGAEALKSCGMFLPELILSFTLIASLMIFEFFTEGKQEVIQKKFLSAPLVIRWAIYLVTAISILYLGVYGASDNTFIYFQF